MRHFGARSTSGARSPLRDERHFGGISPSGARSPSRARSPLRDERRSGGISPSGARSHSRADRVVTRRHTELRPETYESDESDKNSSKSPSRARSPLRDERRSGGISPSGARSPSRADRVVTRRHTELRPETYESDELDTRLSGISPSGARSPLRASVRHFGARSTSGARSPSNI